MSHGTPRGNAGHLKILAAPTSDHTGSCARQPVSLRRLQDVVDCAFGSAPGPARSWKGQCSLGHPGGVPGVGQAGVLLRTRQGGPQRVPANAAAGQLRKTSMEPLAQARPCSHSTAATAAQSTPLVYCLLRGSESPAGSVCIPWHLRSACIQQVLNKYACSLDGREFSTSLGLLWRLVQERGLEGNLQPPMFTFQC